MKYKRAGLMAVGVGAALWSATPALEGQEKPRLSAREIFYSGPQAQAAPAQAAKPAAAAKPKQAKAAPQQVASAAKPTQAPAGKQAEAKPSSSSKGDAQFVPVSMESSSNYPLGIRYSILKREGGEMNEVAPDAVYHAGDKIRLRIEVNDDGYLYIVNRGSSGTWKPLFPAAEIAGGDNRVRRGRAYEVPAGYVFTFDETPGEEKLFVVFSRTPAKEIEDLIYELTGAGKAAQPTSAPKSKESGQPKLLMAKNEIAISDSVVNQMRQVYARDLIIEKVDEAPAAPDRKKEKAVYVVNSPDSADRHVVADITLNHK